MTSVLVVLAILRLATGTIEGVVRDKAGHPLIGAWVYAMPYHGMPLAGRAQIWTQTDAKGHYRLERIPAGRVRIGAFRAPLVLRGLIGDEPGSRTIRVAPDRTAYCVIRLP